jgi:hypothetical protein
MIIALLIAAEFVKEIIYPQLNVEIDLTPQYQYQFEVAKLGEYITDTRVHTPWVSDGTRVQATFANPKIPFFSKT